MGILDGMVRGNPVFIGTISKGRTIRQTVLGGYFFGLAGTFTSFIILGNYGLGLQMHGKLDLMALYEQTEAFMKRGNYRGV